MSLLQKKSRSRRLIQTRRLTPNRLFCFGVFCGTNSVGFVSILSQTKLCSWNFSTKLEFKSFHPQPSSSTAWYGLVCLCLLLARVMLAPISPLTADLSGGSSPASSDSLMTHTQVFLPLCYESTTPMRYCAACTHFRPCEVVSAPDTR